MFDEWDDDGLLGGTVVPRSLLADIGRVAVYYSQADAQLSRVIWMLLGLNDRKGRIVTQAVSSFASRVELFKVLALQRHKRPKARTRINQIVEQLRFAGDDRNRLMHDDIYYSEQDDEGLGILIGTVRSNPITLTDSTHQFDVPVIRSLQTRLHDLYFALYDYQLKKPAWLTEPLPSLDSSPTLLLRRKNEALQRERDKLKPRRKPTRRKSRSRKKPRGS